MRGNNCSADGTFRSELKRKKELCQCHKVT